MMAGPAPLPDAPLPLGAGLLGGRVGAGAGFGAGAGAVSRGADGFGAGAGAGSRAGGASRFVAGCVGLAAGRVALPPPARAGAVGVGDPLISSGGK